ncbi:MAG: cytochrome P450 [Actinobacteria bacterium]|nr:cytochrome P450 [Actinomycetota bacterium]
MSATPVTAAVLRSEEYLVDPFPVWRRMRDDHPLFYDDIAQRWILTRYDDVVSVLGNPQVYSARTYQERFRPVFGRTLAELDGPRHIRERTIVAPAFVGKSLEGYRPFIESSIAHLAHSLEGRDSFDLVDTVTSRLPLHVISALLGFPDDDTDFLFEVGNDVLAGLADVPELRAAGRAAHLRLAEHLGPFIADRREHPAADLISKVVHAEADGERLTHDEICSFISFLLAAGGPTTDMAVRNFWWALLADPTLLERCRDDHDFVDRAFSESLRRDGPIVYEDRRTNVEVEWYGTVIPADTDILVCLGSANTDDSVFARPEEFDPDRPDLLMGVERKPGYRHEGVAGHLAFGLGSHFCMGYQLARVEVVTATEQLLVPLGDVRLAEPQVPRITWFERTVHALPVVRS